MDSLLNRLDHSLFEASLYPNLVAYLSSVVWDGSPESDIMATIRQSGVQPKSLAALDRILTKPPMCLVDGVPFPGENAEFDELVQGCPEAADLQKIIDAGE